MNVQTETLENHVARLTVEVEANQLAKAKKKAARKLAKYVNIPGFRKGKAPYNVLVNYVGEAPILEEAIEELGNDIYRKALEESKVEPYTSGELEDFKLEPQPTFVFTVPLQPTVELGDYESVRADYAPPTVEDSDVDDAMRRLQEEEAVVEDSTQAAKMGDRIVADIHGFFVEEDESDDSDDDEDSDSDEVDEEDFHSAPIHQHDAELYLDVDREPVPGFAEALVGVEAGDRREFVLTYPEDEDKYGEFSEKEVRFTVEVEQVSNVTLPTLNDDFAQKLTEEEDEPLTLLQLRARVRENIENSIAEQYKNDYLDLVMTDMVEGATFAYPVAMVNNQIDSMVESSAQRFGVSLEDYLRLLQKSSEDLHEDELYREQAEMFIKRSLVMRGILDAENIEVDNASIEAELERMLEQFGEQGESFRSLFDTPEMRSNMSNNLLEQKIVDRIVAIGRGEERVSTETADEADEQEPSAEESESEAPAEADEEEVSSDESTTDE